MRDKLLKNPPHFNSEHASRYRFDKDGNFQSSISEYNKFSSCKHKMMSNVSLSNSVAPSAVFNFNSGRIPRKLLQAS